MQLSITLLNNVTDFIIKESGLDKKIDSAIIRNKNITLDDKIKLHFVTFDFIKSLVNDFITNQGNTWLIGSNTIMPSDILVIYKLPAVSIITLGSLSKANLVVSIN